MTPRQKLIAKIKSQGPLDTDTSPVVSLEDFFTGNTDCGSIGCNLDPHPGLQKFFDVLRDIRSRPDVQDVSVSIFEVEERNKSIWPFSERVYVITSATPKKLAKWADALEPGEVDQGYIGGKPQAAPRRKPGMNVLSLWWD